MAVEPPKKGRIAVGFVMHSMQVAGAEMLVAYAVRRLADSITPTVFCLDAVGKLGEELCREGVEVVCLNRRPGVDTRVAWRLAHEARARRLDILHAHQYTPFFYSALARVLSLGRTRLILSEHGRHYPDRVSSTRRWVNRLLLSRMPNAVNACCEFSRTRLAEVDGFPHGQIEIIRNGIDLDRYGSADDRLSACRRLGLDPTRRYLTMIGRFHPVKDHAMLLRTFAEVASSHDDVELLLVGDGPLRPQLEAQAEELGVAERTHFMGVRSDIPTVLKAVSVFLLTSLSEAAALTLLEAMASAVPVVVTDVGGNPEIVRDGVEGFLVPRGAHHIAADRVLRLLQDPQLASRMGHAAMRCVELNHRLDHTLAAYLELYERLSEAPRHAGSSDPNSPRQT